jgi:hypothetical protein
MECLVRMHNVQKIDFDGARMVLTVNGQVYRVDLASVSPRLAHANDAARRCFSISPSGYGIHWPEVDEDLTVHGLIASHQKAEETHCRMKEEPTGQPSLLFQHLHRVIEHVQSTQGRFSELMEEGLQTMPIPFFGDIERAEIITVGVNPAASEFYDDRDWRQIDASPEYLEQRLRSYFSPKPPCPDRHPWFSPWEKSLKLINNRSYRGHAAHLDLSPRATRPMSDLPVEAFLEMVRNDLAIFFETLLLCKHAKVLLLAGCVPTAGKGFKYLNEFFRDCRLDLEFELRGPFEMQWGGGMTCRDTLVSPKLNRPLPVFFFSRSPSYHCKDDLVRLVSKKQDDIIACLNL